MFHDVVHAGSIFQLMNFDSLLPFIFGCKTRRTMQSETEFTLLGLY